ncbi:hypothetical protein F9C07_1184610 [Aspergillus flavus]|uniref:Secreted protein n=1 Tax=Aspergillus flavus (strain ATCC 200026 / FGSC A1120 / IAM 13836 / NRRL 3357 / JCM 12722 / SRRC 167) TaxID=332952 RepID=A0A7U2MD78_ASPFN|nr:hypothetical protein F9C07_1184610 [Aspergillus flavus]
MIRSCTWMLLLYYSHGYTIEIDTSHKRPGLSPYRSKRCNSLLRSGCFEFHLSRSFKFLELCNILCNLVFPCSKYRNRQKSLRSGPPLYSHYLIT